MTEYDPEQPWLVGGQDRHTVTLEDGLSFFEWAAENWPAPRWSVELGPWQDLSDMATMTDRNLAIWGPALR